MAINLPGMMRRCVKTSFQMVGYYILWVLDRIVPKRKTALICTWPDFDDQGLAIESELRKRGVSFQWAVHNMNVPEPPWHGDGKRPVIKRRSLQSILAYLRTGLLFYTHGYFGYSTPPRSKIIVNLWHGMPLKTIGALRGNRVMRFSFTLATSHYFQRILQNAFRVDDDNVLISGLPRNDRLLEAAANPSTRLLPGPIILWMPTYRRPLQRDAPIDGSESGFMDGIGDFRINDFGDALQQLGLTCIIKPHPLADTSTYPAETARVKIWPDQRLLEHGLTLYQLIAQADLLISDASSVWVDYLLLDRPILFAFGDHAEYSSTRGLASPEGLSMFPGPIVTDQDSLVVELGLFSEGIDNYADKRHSVLARFHQYRDSNSAERTVSAALERRGHR